MNEPTQSGLSEDVESLMNVRQVNLGFEDDLHIGSPSRQEANGTLNFKISVGEDTEGKMKLAQDLELNGFSEAKEELAAFAALGITVRSTWEPQIPELSSFIAKEDINIAIDNGKLEIVPDEGGYFEIRRV